MIKKIYTKIYYEIFAWYIALELKRRWKNENHA
jgi:hypothetical protein